MNRRMGLAVAAVVLSLTIGVLVGLVIHTGMQQRADRDQVPSSPPVTETTRDIPASDPADGEVPVESTSDGSASVAAEAAAGAVPADDTGGSRADPPVTSTRTVTVTPSGTATSAGPTTTAGSPAGTSARTGRATATTTTTTTGTRRPTIVRTTVTGTPAGGTAAGTTTTAGTTTSSTTPSPHPGADSPDGPCGTLGQKSSTASGATLYCQHDQRDGSLRWRAVTEGGGCLNRTMTGIGLDGHRYACREGAGGLNHWVRVG